MATERWFGSRLFARCPLHFRSCAPTRRRKKPPVMFHCKLVRGFFWLVCVSPPLFQAPPLFSFQRDAITHLKPLGQRADEFYLYGEADEGGHAAVGNGGGESHGHRAFRVIHLLETKHLPLLETHRFHPKPTGGILRGGTLPLIVVFADIFKYYGQRGRLSPSPAPAPRRSAPPG